MNEPGERQSIYSSQPLVHNRQTRLLHLEHGSWSDQISCKLEVVSLDSEPAPDYETISYVWGSQDEDSLKPIRLDGHEFRGSITERNKQVGLMRDIYAGCKGVLIWLDGINGTEATESDAVAPCRWETHFPVWPAVPAVDEEDRQKIKAFDLHMEVYYGLPFALRHGVRRGGSKWVIQEVVVPPRATVHYGRFVAPWDMFVHAARNFEHHRRICCTKLYTTLNYRDIKMLEGFSRSVVELDNLRVQWRSLMVRAREVDDEDVQEDVRISLRQLLWRFRRRDVTDAKDKIYGLLTLVNDRRGKELSPVDYRCRTQELYRATVEQIVAADRSLLILAGSTDKTAAHGDLPTWVPDWCFKPLSQLENERLERTELFDASGGVEVSPQFVGDALLGLTGGCFDTVVSVSPDCMQYGDSEEKLDVLAKWQAFVTVRGRLPLTSPYPTGETRMAAYWRTLCIDTVRATGRVGTEPWSWDHKHRYTRCPQDYVGKSMRLWMDGDMVPHMKVGTVAVQGWMDYVAVDFAITSAISGRRLFITEKNYMGLGPAGTTEGDMVHVVAGGHTPFVTRRSDKHQAIDIPGVGRQDCLSLIGDCYVHGIMDGEAVKDQGMMDGETVNSQGRSFLNDKIWLA
ncbi:hypothetical protein F5883DRAFT_616865 [Diaporthe sp. PMI_573]|nr:hypothetical protein F5883DRAFT_616865 [Diaporthaceae sp. PMI_573]